MKFMCDEMREGLLAGKKYRRHSIHDIDAFMDSWGDLRYMEAGRYDRQRTNGEDMKGDWEEVSVYEPSIPDAVLFVFDVLEMAHNRMN